MVASIVEGQDFHVLGQDLFVELLGLGLDTFQDILGLLPRPQQDHAFHGIILRQEAELAEARGNADVHTADILDQYRSAVMHREHDVADVLQGA